MLILDPSEKRCPRGKMAGYTLRNIRTYLLTQDILRLRYLSAGCGALTMHRVLSRG